jgi:hypothetical protein
VITPQLVANQVPPGQCFPGTLQLLLNLIAQNMKVTGLDSSTFFSYGPTTPPTDAQGMPWLKTDASFGGLGWYTFAGGEWTPLLSSFQTGMIIPNFLNPPVDSDPWFFCDGIQSARGFTTPDLRGRFLINTGQRVLPSGSTDTATNYTLGLTGGGETTVVAASNLPAHTHTLAVGTSGGAVTGTLQENPVETADFSPGFVSGGNTTGLTNSVANPPIPLPVLNPYFGIPMYMYIAPTFP